MKNLKTIISISLVLFIGLANSSCSTKQEATPLNISEYLNLAEPNAIYPSTKQIEMLKQYMPEGTYTPAPKATDRAFWKKIAASKSGKKYFDLALSDLETKPEVPISDSIYRKANLEGNRGIYKPRYYRTMARLENFILAECMENKGLFIPQITEHAKAIMAMKSWMHPNHDDRENSVLEGKRVAIDLGARKFGSVLSLADVLLEDKLAPELRKEIATQIKWRITDSYLKSCKGEDKKGNTWIRSTSNWNSVCTSGSVFSIISMSQNAEERLITVGCMLNSMKFYLSGFGADGYCSEGVGYWNYGFSHYLYLAEIIADYTQGQINLFDFNNPEKLKKVANFPENFQIQNGRYAPFSDGVSRVSSGNDNFAYILSTKHYGARKPTYNKPDEAVQLLIEWQDTASYITTSEDELALPKATYFDDFGMVISRGQQKNPLAIAIKAGHNAENHNHSDVGTYVVVLGNDIMNGDIGAPSYTAGAFSKDNPARSSWGHPVPRVSDTLQSNGKEFCGKIIETEFLDMSDKVVMDLKPAYEVKSLQKLHRTMINDKSGNGTISIEDQFSASSPISFGTAIMTLENYEIVDANTIIFKTENQTLKAVISSTNGSVKITDEIVPVEHLREGAPAYKIGINFTEDIKEGSITITYTPI